jgi:hypothetical protein
MEAGASVRGGRAAKPTALAAFQALRLIISMQKIQYPAVGHALEKGALQLREQLS